MQYAVPELFNAPQDEQDETERARLESEGLAHMSDGFEDLGFAGFAGFFSILFLAELSKLRLTQSDSLPNGPGPFGAATAFSSTIVLIP